jgi:DNA polymerase
MTFFLDLETFSARDLRKVGTYVYADASEILLMVWGREGATGCWDLTDGSPMPGPLRASLENPEICITAHHAIFDRTVLSRHLGALCLPQRLAAPTPWRCTMAHANLHSLPAGLGELGKVLGLPQDFAKIKDGRRLILKFCKPAPANRILTRYTSATDPVDWALFQKYAINDVVAMRECLRRMPDWNARRVSMAEYQLDQVINDRGFAVDIALVAAGARNAAAEKRQLTATFAELTNHEVSAPTQRAKFKEYLASEFGLKLETTEKATLLEYVEGNAIAPRRAIELMELVLAANKTSTAKYKALQPAVSDDGRFRGGLTFAGANRTRRWGGKLFQPHNLPSRGLPDQIHIDAYVAALKADAHDYLFKDHMLYGSASIRSCVVAPKGKKLCIADKANIEGRAGAWLAGEDWKLDAFRAFDKGIGPDLYNVTAGRILGKPPEAVEKDERNSTGKVSELALSFGGGVGAYQQFSRSFGISMADHWPAISRAVDPGFVTTARKNFEDWGRERSGGEIEETEWVASETVKLAWRARHPETVALWGACQKAAIFATEAPGKKFCVNGKLTFSAGMVGGNLYLTVLMPSNRCLTYFGPKVHRDDKDRPTLSYMGTHPVTKQWGRVGTYGGKLVENLCQSLSRDILAHSMCRAERLGYQIVLTVHDEIVAETPDILNFSGTGLAAIMSGAPKWASDFPLAAAGFEAKRYKK